MFFLRLGKIFFKILSGSWSVGWAKAGIAIVRDPDDWGMVGTLDPSALDIPKGFGLEPLTAEIRAFFKFLDIFNFFILRV